jgi:hypothetical protein
VEWAGKHEAWTDGAPKTAREFEAYRVGSNRRLVRCRARQACFSNPHTTKQDDKEIENAENAQEDVSVA